MYKSQERRLFCQLVQCTCIILKVWQLAYQSTIILNEQNKTGGDLGLIC